MRDEAEESREIPGLKRIVSSLPVDHAGTYLYLRGWRVESVARPPLLIVHDLGEDADRYAPVAEAFASRGYTSYAFDLRGHGRSGRLMGHLPDFPSLVRDLLQIAAWVKHKEAGRAPTLMGQGMGALMVLELAQKYPAFCGGIVLSAPCFELAHEPSWILRGLMRVIRDLVPTWRPPTFMTPNFARQLAKSVRFTCASLDTIMGAIPRSMATLSAYQGSGLILCPEVDGISSYVHLKKNLALHAGHHLKLLSLNGIGRALLTDAEGARESTVREIEAWLEAWATGSCRDAPRESSGEKSRLGLTNHLQDQKSVDDSTLSLASAASKD